MSNPVADNSEGISEPGDQREVESDVLTIFPSRLYGEVKVRVRRTLRYDCWRQACSPKSPSTWTTIRIACWMLDCTSKCSKAWGKHVMFSQIKFRLLKNSPPPSELTWNRRSIRNTLLILRALTARTGSGSVPLPGGCQIGTAGGRAYNLHVELLQTLGAKVYDDGVNLRADAPKG